MPLILNILSERHLIHNLLLSLDVPTDAANEKANRFVRC